MECDGLRSLEITLIQRDKGCGQIRILWSSLLLFGVKEEGRCLQSTGRKDHFGGTKKRRHVGTHPGFTHGQPSKHQIKWCACNSF